MRTSTDAEIVAETPVVQVVARFAARPAIGRHFVLFVPLRGELLLASQLLREALVVIRQVRRRLVMEQRVRFDRQLVV